MKESIRKPENTAHNTDRQSSASRQASVSDVLQAYMAKIVQRQSMLEEDILQRVEIDDEELLQGKFETAQHKEAEIPPSGGGANNTGLPDNLKTGIENLSGYSMDDVRVHYNSSKPTQLQALAYAQGTDIHIAAGQEIHLPHEAWHVVQQKQGRVQPTMQLQGVNVNDNEGLEKEADVMGGKAMGKQGSILLKRNASINDTIAQRIIVRVGYDETKAQDSNPFINGSYKVLENKTKKLKAEGMIPLFDYIIDENTLTKKEDGKNETDLCILGHGRPGFIAGIPVNTLAENLKVKLGESERKKIERIHLYSCFSNIKENDGDKESARDAFSRVFDQVYVRAANGLLYINDSVLPPQYMGYRLGLSFAQKAIIEILEKKGLYTSSYAEIIKNLHEMLLSCILPFDKLLRAAFASKDGFQFTAESKDAILPNIADNGIDSIKSGLEETLENIKKSSMRNEQIAEFSVAHGTCLNNILKLIAVLAQYRD